MTKIHPCFHPRTSKPTASPAPVPHWGTTDFVIIVKQALPRRLELTRLLLCVATALTVPIPKVSAACPSWGSKAPFAPAQVALPQADSKRCSRESELNVVASRLIAFFDGKRNMDSSDIVPLPQRRRRKDVEAASSQDTPKEVLQAFSKLSVEGLRGGSRVESAETS
eukprot:2023887-Rhodomonas_salina.1